VKLVADTGLWCLKEKRPRSSYQAAAISGCAASIASICSGIFIVAAAGLLDARRETVHWAQAKALAQRYPRLQVDSTTSSVQRVGRTASIRRARGLDPAGVRQRIGTHYQDKVVD
jgi:AraC family transcriptional activator FtrA